MLLVALLHGCSGEAEPTPNGMDAPPWPTGGVLDRHGDTHCTTFARPCNHAIHMAVRDLGGEWEVLPAPLVQSGSVPDGIVVPTDHEGEEWEVLWITYIDENPGNRTREGQDHVVSVATLAWRKGSVRSSADARTLLEGEGWSFDRTNLADVNPTAVDPDRVVIDTPRGRRHYLVAVDLVVEAPAAPGQGGVSPAPPLLYESVDGLTFANAQRLIVDAPQGFGTDPDFFPLGWTEAYPAVLPSAYAPGGEGRWGAWASNGPRLHGFQGDLRALRRTFELGTDGSVSSTTLRDGHLFTYAHRTREARLDLPADAVLHQVFPDGSFSTRVSLAGGGSGPTANGVWSPTVLPLAEGVELMLFHTYRRLTPAQGHLPPGAPGSPH